MEPWVVVKRKEAQTNSSVQSSVCPSQTLPFSTVAAADAGAAGHWVAAACFLAMVARLTRVDSQLKHLEVGANIFNWSGDRMMHEVDEGHHDPHNLYRTREHPLSARSPRYDTRDLLLCKLTMLNSSFFGRIIMAAVRVALGGLKGCYHDCYFPVLGQSEDYNSLQTGIDAGILAIYVAALLAAVVAEHCDEEVLDSLWLTLTPLVAFPAICFGFYLRGRHAANPEAKDDEPLLP